jgi:hypothetical protein
VTLAEATRQYQAVLEYLRAEYGPEYLPDPEDQTALDEAERAMNTAWMEHTTAKWWDS